MSSRRKGPRLWLQPARKRSDGRTEHSVWVIRDGNTKISTGAGPSEIKEAEAALGDYIIAKTGAPRVSNRDPAHVRVADVVSIYTDDAVHKHSRPAETAARLERIVKFFGVMTLAQLNKRSCGQYVEHRGHQAAARRELEDLRAAVRHHWEAGLCSALTPVILPTKGAPRDRWLKRKEAAALLKAAWRVRQKLFGKDTERNTAQHVARFILVALYTGTRAGAICGAALAPTAGHGWIDLEHGVFYRRAAGTRETKKRKPPVRLPPRLLAHLRRWKRLRISGRFVVEYHGRPVHKINKAFRTVRKLAGLGPDVTPHTFRHTCATWLAQADVPAFEAAGFLGMTVETFERVYGHHCPSHQHRAVGAFDRQVADRMNVNETRQATPKVVKLRGNH